MVPSAPFQLIDVLRKHDVPFVIIGGHAVSYHGFVRNTEDVDIIVLRTPDSVRSLFAALSELNAQWIGTEIDPETNLEKTYRVTESYVEHTHLMMLCTDLGFLDVFDYVPGLENQPVIDLLDTAIQTDHGPVVSLPWLRKLKAASGRAKDKVDLENLPDAEDGHARPQ